MKSFNGVTIDLMTRWGYNRLDDSTLLEETLEPKDNFQDTSNKYLTRKKRIDMSILQCKWVGRYYYKYNFLSISFKLYLKLMQILVGTSKFRFQYRQLSMIQSVFSFMIVGISSSAIMLNQPRNDIVQHFLVSKAIYYIFIHIECITQHLGE